MSVPFFNGDPVIDRYGRKGVVMDVVRIKRTGTVMLDIAFDDVAGRRFASQTRHDLTTPGESG